MVQVRICWEKLAEAAATEYEICLQMKLNSRNHITDTPDSPHILLSPFLHRSYFGFQQTTSYYHTKGNTWHKQDVRVCDMVRWKRASFSARLRG